MRPNHTLFLWTIFFCVSLNAQKISINPSHYFQNAKEGSINRIEVVLKPAPLTDQMIGFAFSGTNSASNTGDIEYSSPTTNTLIVRAGDTSASFSFRGRMDLIDEPSDTFLFRVVSIPSGTTLDTISFANITLSDSTVPPVMPNSPYFRIATIRGKNTSNVPDSIGKRCTVRGILYGINNKEVAYKMSICDGTGCIGILSDKIFVRFPVAKEGDSVEISGLVRATLGYGYINFSGNIDTIFLQGFREVLAPKVVTVLDESTESNLVKIDNLQIVEGEWKTNELFTLKMKNQFNNIFNVTIDNVNNRFSSMIKMEKGFLYNIVGIGGQYDTAFGGGSPNSYELLPRYLSDIKKIGNAPSSIKDLQNEDQVIIYPNPLTTKDLLIDSKRESKNTRVEIYDQGGKMVFQSKIHLKIGLNKLEINKMLSIANGLYQIILSSENFYQEKKIVFEF
jgi:hypothetical protein